MYLNLHQIVRPGVVVTCLFVATLFLSFESQADQTDDVNDEVPPCSSHGHLVPTKDGPQCACDPGYVADQFTGKTCFSLLTRPVSTGWALPATIFGFLSSGSAFVLGAVGFGESPPLMYTSYIISGVSFPVVAGGALSARCSNQVAGSKFFRVIGWNLYGIALISSFTGIYYLGASDPGPFIGAVAVLSISIDALVSHREAKKLMEKGSSYGFSITPVPDPHSNKAAGAVLGLSGTF